MGVITKILISPFRIKLEIKVEDASSPSDSKQKKQVSLNNYFTSKNSSSSSSPATTNTTTKKSIVDSSNISKESNNVSSTASPKTEPVDVKNVLRIKNESSANYTCDICSKSFAFESSLKSHKMFHSSSSSIKLSPSKRAISATKAEKA